MYQRKPFNPGLYRVHSNFWWWNEFFPWAWGAFWVLYKPPYFFFYNFCNFLKKSLKILGKYIWPYFLPFWRYKSAKYPKEPKMSNLTPYFIWPNYFFLFFFYKGYLKNSKRPIWFISVSPPKTTINPIQSCVKGFSLVHAETLRHGVLSERSITNLLKIIYIFKFSKKIYDLNGHQCVALTKV